MIPTEHQNEVDLSGVASHVVAVAKTSSQAMFPSALSFAAGDHITVTQRISMDTFHGNNRGKSGTFFASDVVFHTGKSSLTPSLNVAIVMMSFRVRRATDAC